MDQFEGTGWLDWWANSTTLLGSAEVFLTITPTTTGWDARGRLAHAADTEAFAFLCSLDPVFTLRFADDSTVAVSVHPADDGGSFTLTEYTGPAHRPVDYRFDV